MAPPSPAKTGSTDGLVAGPKYRKFIPFWTPGCSGWQLQLVWASLYNPIFRHYNHDPMPRLAAVLLPARIIAHVWLMLWVYCILLVFAGICALWIRLRRGKASDILRHGIKGPWRFGASYPSMFVFSKPFDPERLSQVFWELMEEAGADPRYAAIEFMDEVPGPFPESCKCDADHYVDRGLNYFKRAFIRMSDMHIVIQVFNGAPGQPTVVHAFLPGHVWDGTSCFNCMKELVNRYYGGRSKVFLPADEQLTLSAQAAERLDTQYSFGRYMAKLPAAVFRNSSDMVWQWVTVPRVFGGSGWSAEVTLLNFDEEESRRMAEGLRDRGAKPLAGMIYAAFQAYKAVLGRHPFSIIEQASMQTRSYEPTITTRDLVGDWLVGPSHRFDPRKDFSLEDAQAVYETLVRELNNLEGRVLEAAYAKAYSPFSGAAVFELIPSYGESFRIFDSIFFNNYGLREIHPDAGFHSFNWAAPFKLGFNTSCVNGKTCTSLASSVVGRSKLEAMRDHVEATLRGFMSCSA